MKKLLVISLLLLGVVKANAEDLCADLGKFSACVPVLSGLNASFGYDFKGHQSQGLAETTVGKWNVTEDSRLNFTLGAATVGDGEGSPFGGIDYELKSIENPLSSFMTIKPGVYGGKNFDNGEYFYGVKASIPIIK